MLCTCLPTVAHSRSVHTGSVAYQPGKGILWKYIEVSLSIATLFCKWISQLCDLVKGISPEYACCKMFISRCRQCRKIKATSGMLRKGKANQWVSDHFTQSPRRAIDRSLLSYRSENTLPNVKKLEDSSWFVTQLCSTLYTICTFCWGIWAFTKILTSLLRWQSSV